MTTQPDPRIAELTALAQEEGITLPMPVEMIVYFERQGRIVDLERGRVYSAVTVMPTPSAKAVAYLLALASGEIVI
jgi:hypothetical protein